MSQWQNRIIETGTQPASQFTPHPDNARRHPTKQRDAVRSSLDKFGACQFILVNQQGTILDGHERVWQALDNDDAELPYAVLDLTEEEERLFLMMYDRTGEMAEWDGEALSRLLEDVQTGLDPVIDSMLAELASEAGVITDLGGDGLDDSPPVDKRIQCPECGCVFEG